jgi:hypothetical protein
MAFPSGWPPRPASGRRSIRVYKTGVVTASFDGAAFLFIDDVGANTFLPIPFVAPGSSTVVAVGTTGIPGSPLGGGEQDKEATKPSIFSCSIRIVNIGAGDLEISFDGTNIHGYVKENAEVIYKDRYEAGIALRGVGGATPTYRVEAW